MSGQSLRAEQAVQLFQRAPYKLVTGSLWLCLLFTLTFAVSKPGSTLSEEFEEFLGSGPCGEVEKGVVPRRGGVSGVRVKDGDGHPTLTTSN